MYSQQSEPALRRVRCVRCQKLLWQQYQGDVGYTLHIAGEQSVAQVVPGYEYRELSDRRPVVTCPGCGVVLSPAVVTVVPVGQVVVIQEKPARRSSGRWRR
jgi:hypothetical protein